MEFISQEISDYAVAHSSKQSDLLAQLERETNSNVLLPRMLSGPLQGRVLSSISKMLQPKNILEIGTYTGYSALCLAEGLSQDGQLHTLERNEELETLILRYFKQSAYANQLHLHIGNASELIPSLELSFDLVFIDADKINYLSYYELLIDQLPSGAVILADNVLWSGKVTQVPKENDLDTAALDLFNKTITSDPRVENILLPIRDGIMLIRKI